MSVIVFHHYNIQCSSHVQFQFYFVKTDRIFRNKKYKYFKIKELDASVPQVNVVGPILCPLCKSDILRMDNVQIAQFADVTALIEIGQTRACPLENYKLPKIIQWPKEKKLKLNELEPIYISFTNKNQTDQPPLDISGIRVPCENEAKYLGMT